MPYITQEERVGLDEKIQALLDEVKQFADGAIEGVMNYTITSLLSSFKRGDGRWRYCWINRVIGTLECVKLEFYRRLASPYEENAILKNGDLPIYEEYPNDSVRS